MKTIYKTYTWLQARKKKKELEGKYYIKWDYYGTGDGVRFCPIILKNTERIEKYVKNVYNELTTEYIGFIALWEKLKPITLVSIVEACAYLVFNTNKVVVAVNRNGNICAIRKKRKGEK